MAHTHGQRRLLSATRRGALLLGLAAAIGLAIAAASVSPSWSPLLRSPLPDPSSASVGDRVVVRERAPVRHPSEIDRAAAGVSADVPAPVPAPAPSVEQPPSPASKQPGVVVSTPAPPERVSAPAGDRASPKKPEAAPVSEPVPPAPAPALPPEVEGPPEAPPPLSPEAVVSTHPGQGNAYGKGNGNGPPGGVPPGQVGR